jgi:hypothetical protein
VLAAGLLLAASWGVDRELQHVTEMFGDLGEAEEAQTDGEAGATQFSADGRLPGVAQDMEGDTDGAEPRSASDLAFSDASYSDAETETESEEHDSDASHDTHTRSLASAGGAKATAASAKHEKPVYFHGGEPLPVLKTYLQGEINKPKLAAFISMMKHSPVRAGNVRTPTSPADGIAAIITGVILRICDKYSGIATAKQRRFLEHTVIGHERLLTLPLNTGGHRRKGIVGNQNDGLAGPTRPYSVVTANQTAVVLTSLLMLAQNDKFKRQRPKLMRLYRTLAPEFKQGLLELYDPHKSPHHWQYGSSGRLEDQSHLKTTYEELKKLGHLAPGADAKWYEHQVERIAHQYPKVKKSWEENGSNVAGSLG